MQDPEDGDEVGEDPTAPTLCSIIAVEVAETHSDLRLEEVRRAAACDPELQALLEVIQNGFPKTKSELPEIVRPYWLVHERLSVDDGLAVCGCRPIIPPDYVGRCSKLCTTDTSERSGPRPGLAK